MNIVLQIVKWTTPPKMPECFQRAPKQFNVPRSSKILALTLDKKGEGSIHSRLTIDVHSVFFETISRSEVFSVAFFHQIT